MANCLIKNFSIMYQFKQDLAMAYFPHCSKKTASRLLAREINLTPGLLFCSPLRYRNIHWMFLLPPSHRLPPPSETPLTPPAPNPLLLPRRTVNKYPPNTTKGEMVNLALNHYLYHHHDIPHHHLQHQHLHLFHYQHLHQKNENKFCQYYFYMYLCNIKQTRYHYM